jgi:hypothetical protein
MNVMYEIDRAWQSAVILPANLKRCPNHWVDPVGQAGVGEKIRVLRHQPDCLVLDVERRFVTSGLGCNAYHIHPDDVRRLYPNHPDPENASVFECEVSLD